MPQADSVGWDMPVPVPIACAQLGREGEERGGAVPEAEHTLGFAGCHGGGPGQVLAAALALSPSWAPGGSGGHGVPWALRGLGKGGWEA